MKIYTLTIMTVDCLDEPKIQSLVYKNRDTVQKRMLIEYNEELKNIKELIKNDDLLDDYYSKYRDDNYARISTSETNFICKIEEHNIID